MQPMWQIFFTEKSSEKPYENTHTRKFYQSSVSGNSNSMSHMRTHRKEAISVQAMWKRFFTEDAFWGKNKNVAILEIAGTTLYNDLVCKILLFFYMYKVLDNEISNPCLVLFLSKFYKKKSIFILFWMLFRGFLGHKRSLAGPKPNFFYWGVRDGQNT